MNEAGALVLGADYRSLGICRSLGRRGITAWVAVEFDDDLATHSKFVRRTVPWPGAFDTDQTEFLLHLAEDEGIKGWVLFPTGDKSANFVSRHHAELEQAYRLTTPPHASYDAAQDKRQVYARAQALGIAVPSTWYTDSLDEAAALDLEYPVILKPATGAITNPISDKPELARTERRRGARTTGVVCGRVGGSGAFATTRVGHCHRTGRRRRSRA